MHASSTLAVNAAASAAAQSTPSASASAPCAADGALPADDGAPACGWFDSSWALQQGLAVSELPDSDGTVAALWFAELAPRRRPASARLQ